VPRGTEGEDLSHEVCGKECGTSTPGLRFRGREAEGGLKDKLNKWALVVVKAVVWQVLAAARSTKDLVGLHVKSRDPPPLHSNLRTWMCVPFS